MNRWQSFDRTLWRLWLRPLLQSRVREAGFGLLKEELKLGHGRILGCWWDGWRLFCTCYRLIWADQLTLTNRRNFAARFIIHNRVGAEREWACLCTTMATTFVDLNLENKSVAFLQRNSYFVWKYSWARSVEKCFVFVCFFYHANSPASSVKALKWTDTTWKW